jgi:hypothetical protein
MGFRFYTVAPTVFRFNLGDRCSCQTVVPYWDSVYKYAGFLRMTAVRLSSAGTIPFHTRPAQRTEMSTGVPYTHPHPLHIRANSFAVSHFVAVL